MVKMLDIPDYAGPGVYSIIDENGKRYIGSSKNIKKRIQEHNSSMIKAAKDTGIWAVNKEIDSAVKNGVSFRVEVLHKFEDGCTFYDLVDMERKYIDYFGGAKNTYNSMITADLRVEDYKSLRYYERKDSEKAREYVKYFRGKIEEREKMIYPIQLKKRKSRTERKCQVKQPRGKVKRKRFAVIVPEDIWPAIQAAAEAAGQSLNAYTRQAIQERMERERAGD